MQNMQSERTWFILTKKSAFSCQVFGGYSPNFEWKFHSKCGGEKDFQRCYNANNSFGKRCTPFFSIYRVYGEFSLSKSGLPGKSPGRPQSIKIHMGRKQQEREMRYPFCFPSGQLFEIHGSKLKPHPFGELGKTSIKRELARVFWTIFFGKSKMPSPISCLEIIAFYLAWSPITKFLMRSAVIEKARRNRENRSNTKLKGKSIRSKAGDCESQSPCILYS